MTSNEQIPASVGRYFERQTKAAMSETELGTGEAGPNDCTCWATSRQGCPVHAVDDQDADAEAEKTRQQAQGGA